MTLDTNDGRNQIRAELDKLDAAETLAGVKVPGDEPMMLSVTQAEYDAVLAARISASRAKLKELGFSGPVTRV
jgi:exo-beta-1,3-glucanase (GH17 family)